GGAPRDVLASVKDADWSADGKQLAVLVRGNQDELQFPVGRTVHRALSMEDICLSPSGDRFAVLEGIPGRLQELVVVDLAGKRSVLGTRWRVSGLDWSPDGREVWFTGAQAAEPMALHALALDG